MADRRRAKARPRLTGHRRSDPTLTTRDCADRLGVSTTFILEEIRDGRLRAVTDLHRAGKRGVYRISEDDWDAFLILGRWRPKVLLDSADDPDAADRAKPADKPLR